jgi:hypothetical protein
MVHDMLKKKFRKSLKRYILSVVHLKVKSHEEVAYVNYPLKKEEGNEVNNSNNNLNLSFKD